MKKYKDMLDQRRRRAVGVNYEPIDFWWPHNFLVIISEDGRPKEGITHGQKIGWKNAQAH